MIEDVAYPTADILIEIHRDLIATYGGAEGIRNLEGLNAALARAEQIRAYAEGSPDIFALAAAIAYRLCKIHHPFVDGNKRIAFDALFVTLHMNGYFLDVAEKDAENTILAVASGAMGESDFARWIMVNSYERD